MSFLCPRGTEFFPVTMLFFVDSDRLRSHTHVGKPGSKNDQFEVAESHVLKRSLLILSSYPKKGRHGFCPLLVAGQWQ
jgi:hypothetical protein